MSDLQTHPTEVPWWQQEKAKSLERKAQAKRDSALAQPGDTFLIVTEGDVTEPVYFELLKNDLRLTRAEVYVTPGDTSDSKRVIETAARIAKDRRVKGRRGKLALNQLISFDHVWAVIDSDQPTRQGKWHEVEELAQKLKVKLAHSTPCFEF